MARTKVELSFNSFADFPDVWSELLLYVATDADLIYRWDWTQFVVTWWGWNMSTWTYDPSSIAKDLFATSQKVYVNATTWDDSGWNGSVNAPYLTIQAAIDNTSWSIVIQLAPWTYTDNITMRTWLSINWWNTIITWKIVWNGVNFFQDLTLTRTSTVTETFIDAATNATVLIFDFCAVTVNTATNDIQSTIIDYSNTWSTIELLNTNINYTNTSTWTNSTTTSLIKWNSSWFVVNNWVTITTSSWQSSWDIIILDDAWAGVLTNVNVLVSWTITNAAYSWIMAWYRSTTTWFLKTFGVVQVLLIWNWSGTWVWYILDSSSNSQTVKINGWRTDVLWFATNKYTDIATTDTVESFFNIVLGALTNTWAWTLSKVDSIGWELRINTNIIDENLLLGTPTNETLQSFFNIIWSSWVVSGWVVTDAGGGAVNVTAGTGLIRNSNSDMAPIFSFDWTQSLWLALAEGNNVVYIDYNAGSPIIAVTQTRNDILDNENDKFELVEVVREWTDLHISDHRQLARSQWQQKSYSLTPVARADSSGLILGETGTRNVTMTEGSIWRKYVRWPVPAVDTSVSGGFDSYYTTDSFSTWTKVSDDTQWNNTQYNDITSWLVAISPSARFSFQDFYINGDGELTRVYAQAQYASLSAAEEAPTSSSLPPRLQFNSLLIGRIVFQGNDATAQSILSAFDITFSGAAVTDHGALSGLADDDHMQYALLAWRSWWQTQIWGTDVSDDLTLQSTSNATKGKIIIAAEPLDQNKWTDIASATTTDIWAATWNFVDITWTTTITWFGTVQDWTQRTLQFDWILILTHNGTSLILPTWANITTAAWDSCDMISLWSGNWKCVNYQRADWTALASAWWGWTWFELLDSSSLWSPASSITSWTFSAKNNLKIKFYCPSSSWNTTLRLRFNWDTWSNYAITHATFNWASASYNNAVWTSLEIWEASNALTFNATINVNNATSTDKWFTAQCYSWDQTWFRLRTSGWVWIDNSNDITSVTLLTSANNFNAWTRLQVYGAD